MSKQSVVSDVVVDIKPWYVS